MTTKERLEENEVEDGAVYFDHPEFQDPIIGTTFDVPARVVYDYNLMIEEYSRKQGVTTEEAADFISYNCARSASYLGSSAPIIVFTLIV